jgi:tetraacyldisaccharide 4'-kinase
LIRGQRRGVLAACSRLGLYLASLPYHLVVRGRNLGHDRGWLTSYGVAAPVISVGNLTVGGTGKTPCVAFVANHYRQRDYRVCILSRGYGAQGETSDEARVLEEELNDVPHLQGPDRVQLARVALEELESEILVLDDGFQHRRLNRDLDLVLIDATDPWGQGYLLPRGLLREPRSSLRRAHLAILTRCDQVAPPQLEQVRQQVRRLAPQLPLAETRHRPTQWSNSAGETLALDDLSSRPAAAFCGIGNPQAFRRTLDDLGVEVRAFRTYPDHHRYARADVLELEDWLSALPGDVVVLTTQKDLVKLRITHLGDRPLWALRIQLHFQVGQELLEQHLDALLPGDSAEASATPGEP